MTSPLNPLEIFLKPGDCYFGGQNTSIRTVLGSCVSMTFWHPQLRVGGMCHYMLPKRSKAYRLGDRPVPDGRYADEAIALLLAEIDAIGAAYREFQVRLFGGGNMFPQTYKAKLSSSSAHTKLMPSGYKAELSSPAAQAKLMASGHKNALAQIGFQNVQAARRIIKQYGFICVDEHLGDIWPRKVVFEVWSGNVSVTHSDLSLTANYKPLNRSLE